jgi:hypothetical protein
MLTEFDEFVLTKLPHFVAKSYRSMLEQAVPEKKVQAVLYIYDLGLRTLTLGMVSQYITRDKLRVRHPHLNELITEKLPRARLEIWQNIFFSILRAYEGNRGLFFMPELYDFFWDISKTPHQPRPGLEASFSRLTQIHYDLNHGLSPTTVEGWNKLLEEALGLLREFLNHFAFIQNYELIRVIGREGRNYTYERHVGLTITPHQFTLPETIELDLDWFYLSKQSKDFLLLDPLLVFWQSPTLPTISADWDTGVFERFNSNQLQYLLSNFGRTVQDDQHVAAFVQLIDTIRQTKLPQQELEKLTWLQFQEVAKNISRQRMSTIRDKYNPNLYLQRNKIKAAFDDFLSSEKKGFILVGKSGVGKSNFILALADEFGWDHHDVCLLMYDAANLDPAFPLNEQITQSFKNYLLRQGREIENIWHEVSEIDDIEEKKVVLCIDAINENPDGHVLLKQINELIQDPWPWLRVVVTSRPEAWLNMKIGIKLAETLFYRPHRSDRLFVEMENFTYSQKLESFSEDELPQVYEKYQQAYQLQTNYENLPAAVKRSLQDPLVLWLTANIYQGDFISTSVKTIDVIPEYLKAMLKTERLEDRDVTFLQETLMPLMVSEGSLSNAIKAQQIDQAGQKLVDLINVESKLSNGRRVNQSFENLMDTEVLVRRGEVADYEITFKYERFYDYFAGLRLVEIFNQVQDRYGLYANLVAKTRARPFLWGAIKSLLINDLQRDMSIAIPLAQSQEYFERELIISALIDLGKDDGTGVTDVVTELMGTDQISHGRDKRLKDKSRIRFGKLTAIEVASQLMIKTALLRAVEDIDQDIRVAAVQQIYHHLTLKNTDLVFDILDEIAARAFARWHLPSLHAIESHVIISLLILFNYFEDPIVLGNLQSRWNKIFARIPFFGTKPGRGIRTQISARVRDLILNIIVIFFIRALREMSNVVVVSVEDLESSFHQSQHEIERLKRVVRYIDMKRASIHEIQGDLVEIAQSRDLLTMYALSIVFFARFLSERNETIALAREVFNVSWSQDPPTPVLAGLMLALESVLTANINTFDEELWLLHEGMFRELFKKSNLVHGQHKTYFWGGYHGYYHDLHISEEDSDEVKEYLKKMETEGAWVRLQNHIAFISQANLDRGLNRGSVSKLFAYLDHSSQDIRNSAIQALASLRAKYTLEIDQLIKEQKLPLEVRISIENHRVHQNMGVILTISMYNFWTRAILNQDDRFISYVFEVVEYIDESKNLRQFLVFIINRLIQLVYSGNIKT